jgi:myo-inositol-1(or 4)-monophosphatase
MALRSALINVIFKAASKAARRMMRDFGEAENLQVSRKGAADFVSQADLSAERTLRDELEYARPGWNMILEESGHIKGESSDAPTWIIDPLDGTTNFLHGIPHFAISIAVLDNKKLRAAGILDPIRDEFFFAELGKGAYLNDRRIRVSSRKQVESALFATGIPFLGRTTSEQERIFINQLNHVMPKCSGIRRFGSAALDLAWVAAGRYDGFWEHGLQQWDIAAGALIVREAGGFVSDFSSRDTVLQTGNIVAANGGLHVPLLKMLREGEKA